MSSDTERPEELAWTPKQRRTLRHVGVLSFGLGIWYGYSCLVEEPSHGPWWPYQCAPSLIAIILAAALWQGATGAVVALFGVLVISILLLLWETFTGEAAALLLLWVPILFLAGLFRAVGPTTWARLRRRQH